jgi:hypothetical protein
MVSHGGHGGHGGINGFGTSFGFLVSPWAFVRRARKTDVKRVRTDQVILRVLRVPSVSSVRDRFFFESEIRLLAIIRFSSGETALVSRFEPWLP